MAFDIAVLVPVPPTPQEIARRKALAQEVLRLREEMEPLDITDDELVRLGRTEPVEP